MKIKHRSRRVLLCAILGFIMVSSKAQQYFPVKIDHKWGLIDSNGEVFLEPVYDAIGEFKTYGYAIMQRGGGVGLIDHAGKEIVDPIWDDIRILDSLLFAVMDANAWTVIDHEGKVILDKGFDEVEVLSGLLIFKRDGLWGMSNSEGKSLCEPIYSSISTFDLNFFQVRTEGGVGLVNRLGKEIIEPVQQSIEKFSDELFFFLDQEGLWGAVDDQGFMPIPPSFVGYQPVDENFIKLFGTDSDKLYALRTKIIIGKGDYDDYYPFNQKAVLVKKNRLMGLMDEKGRQLITCQFNEIHYHREGIYRVRYKNKWGLIKTGNTWIIQPTYDYILPSAFPVSVMKKDSLFGLINIQGELLSEAIFDEIKLSSQQAKAYKNGQLTLFDFDETGKTVSESDFSNHFTITIGKPKPEAKKPLKIRDVYQLDQFEWFYSSIKDKWGLRRIDNGELQIEPAFDIIHVLPEVGWTLVGVKQPGYYDFEFTKFRFNQSFGIVNNELGRLVRELDLWDVRLEDFSQGFPIARVIFSSGKHGLIKRSGKVIKNDCAYIGSFQDGLARISLKGHLSGSLHEKERSLGLLRSYLKGHMALANRIDYTDYDQKFAEQAMLVCEECQWGYVDTLGRVKIDPEYDYVSDFTNEIGIVNLDGKWGMIDGTGRRLLPVRYDRLEFLENTDNKMLRVYQKSNKYGLIDTLGNVKVDFKYDELGAFYDGRLAVKRNNLWGYVNRHGTEVIPSRFKRARNFSEELAAVQLGNAWGFIDRLGNVVIAPQFKRVGNFRNGLAWAKEGTKVGYIDKKGEWVFEPIFDAGHDFQAVVARVKVDNKYGLINQKGEYILDPIYSDISSFDPQGLAKVRFAGRRNRFGLIDMAGRLLTSRRYQEIREFKENLAVVKLRNKYGYINTSGKLVINPEFEKASGFSEDRAAVQVGRDCGYINKLGELVIACQYSKCLDFRDGRAVVYEGYRKGGVINKDGEVIIAPSINRLLEFSEDQGLVRDGQYRFYYITEAAKRREGTYQKASPFQHGIAVVQSEGKWGIINQKGIAIIPPKYDKIEDFKDGYAKVRIRGFSGLTNLKGQLLVQPDYEYISYAGEGLFRVEQGDKIGYFDREGNWIWQLNE